MTITIEHIIFGVAALVTLGAALGVVTSRNLVHSALWLVLSLFGVAVVYVLLSAAFLAVVQVVIYIGAIAILLIFAIMLTRDITSENRPQINENSAWAVVITAILFGGLLFMFFALARDNVAGLASTAPALNTRVDPLVMLGQALVSPDAYVLPFELASVLLLAALIGALVIAWDRK